MASPDRVPADPEEDSPALPARMPGAPATPAGRPGEHPLRRRRGFLAHARPAWVPRSAARFRYTFGLGGAAVFLFIALLVTGVPLLFHYQPGEGAYQSVSALTYVLPYGWLFRSLHFWAAQLLVVVTVLHLLRVTLTAAYRYPRRFNWLVGLGLLVLVAVLDYTGYLLRGDLEGLDAASVGRAILQSVPLVGQGLAALVFSSGGAAALLALSAWHNLLLPVFGLALIGWHLWRVRRDGGISRPFEDDGTYIPLSVLAAREWVAGLTLANALLLLSLVLPPSLGLPPDQVPPGVVRAPWVFGAVQVLLRQWSPLTAGVVAPVFTLLLLGSAPYLAESRPALGRGLVTFIFVLIGALTLYFWWRG